MPSPIRAMLLLILVAIPLLEIALLVKVGQALGFWWTILIVVGTAVAGSTLLHRQGIDTIRRVMAAAASGQPPVESLLDGVVLIMAGVLLLTPGLITDALGLLLLIPPVRWLLIRKALKRIIFHGSFETWTADAEAPDETLRRQRESPHGQARHGRDEGIVIEGEYQRLDETDTRRSAPGARPKDAGDNRR